MIKKPRGTQDFLPPKSEEIAYLEEKAAELFKRYGYGRMITPIFESTDLFTRSIGETTDIVSKEMYTFNDKKGRSLTLRPEGTAPIVRAYIEDPSSFGLLPAKVYYIGQMFRYERPQAGRYREFWQIGVEAIGSSDAVLDAEIIDLLMSYLEEVGLINLDLKINSMGCKNDRAKYSEQLKDYLRSKKADLCKDCRQRVEVNPLRVFDCKNKDCQMSITNAPKIIDYICKDCNGHFEKVKGYLGATSIKYKVESRLVRGFDYYTRTVFEVASSELGAQDALGGGGRYDNLIADYGGDSTPAIGFAFGLERIILARQKQGKSKRPTKLHLWISYIDEESKKEAFKLLLLMRKNNISADMSLDYKNLKAQLRQADKRDVGYSLVIGPDEIASGKYALKDMNTKEQQSLCIDEIVRRMKDEG
ncbi:MAG: histidine--tRNA ligase [Actinobacteria bacterium]|nr:MAG: histidine--tRNA ligase [Actinomycetota bacterium]